MKRRPETLKWDRELFAAMNFVPWSIDDPVVTPETGWEPFSGCKACDEERSGVKLRDRPFSHTPECNERQADFRARLRETKMLSASGASRFSSSVLDTSIGTDPLLSGPSVQAESSSSCFEVVTQRESGDMEIATVNEKLHSLVPELKFTDEKEWQALSAERDSEPHFCSTLGPLI